MAVCVNGHKNDALHGFIEPHELDWRTESWAAPEFRSEVKASSTSDFDETSYSTAAIANGFVTHKVSNSDTLAGLAIKYKVPISHIRMANGILSDSAMYGRRYLIIPVDGLPMREEMSAVFAQLAAQMGREPVPSISAARNPSAAAAARIARALEFMNGDEADDGSPDEGWGAVDIWGSSSDKVGQDALGELIGSESEHRAGSHLLRSTSRDLSRRRGGEAGGRSSHRSADVWDGGPRPGSDYASHKLSRLNSSETFKSGSLMSGISESMEKGRGFFANLSKSIADSELVQKIKHAASQPALGGQPMSRARSMQNISRASAQPGSTSGQRGDLGRAASSIPVSYAASSSPPRRWRDGGKNE